MIVRRYTDLQQKNLEEIHNKNNQEILEKITNFMNHNNLSAEDFFIGGSSCCSYMNYFILSKVQDVDIFMLKDIEVEKTDGIDVIINQAITGYEPELVEKDGFYFISAWHALMAFAVKALLKKQKHSILYFKVLLHYYFDMTIEEFQEHFEQEWEQHVFQFRFKEDALNIVTNSMPLLQEWGKAPKSLPDYFSATPITLSEEETTKRITIVSGAIPDEYYN